MIENFLMFKLNSDTNLKPFKCSDDDLNGFLYDDALNFHNQKLATTYILENEDSTVAYFSLLNDKISVTDLDRRKLKDLFNKRFPYRKRLNHYPAVKLGRLAVSEEFVNMGLGRDILRLIKTLFTTNNRTGCRFITVDAYSVAFPFYEKNSFKFFSGGDKDSEQGRSTRLMFYDLQDFS